MTQTSKEKKKRTKKGDIKKKKKKKDRKDRKNTSEKCRGQKFQSDYDNDRHDKDLQKGKGKKANN